MLIGVARGLALFLGGFTLLNLFREWIDLWPLPATVARVVLAIAAIAMIAFAIRPRAARWRRAATSALMFALFAGNTIATIRYYYAFARGEIRTTFPLPLSLPIALVMLLLAVAPYHDARISNRAFLVSFVIALILFPLAQMENGPPARSRRTIGPATRSGNRARDARSLRARRPVLRVTFRTSR